MVLLLGVGVGWLLFDLVGLCEGADLEASWVLMGVSFGMTPMTWSFGLASLCAFK